MRSGYGVHLWFATGLAFGLAIPASLAAQAMQHDKAPANPSTTLTVKTPGGQVSFSVNELKTLPQTSITVHNAHNNRDEHYTGAKLMDVLVKAGVKPGKGTLHSYIMATGTDGYWVLYSGEEISDVVHAGEVIVAIAESDQPLHEDGEMKLISSEDRKPERWVRNLQAIQWREATP